MKILATVKKDGKEWDIYLWIDHKIVGHFSADKVEITRSNEIVQTLE